MQKMVLSILLLVSGPVTAQELPSARAGDILFQTSKSAQSQAVQLATHSRYSHMGIVLIRDGKPCVFEAADLVRCTALKLWIDRGESGHYVMKRLKDPTLLNAEGLKRLDALADTLEGIPYDVTFEWDDARMYCSELVWKLFDRALAVRVGELAKLGDMDLSSSAVQKIMKQRYKGGAPLDMPLISPAAMFSSPLLEEAARG